MALQLCINNSKRALGTTVFVQKVFQCKTAFKVNCPWERKVSFLSKVSIINNKKKTIKYSLPLIP